MFTLEVQGLRDDLRVVKLVGEEGLSRPYRFDLSVVSRERTLASGDVIGREARLTLSGQGEARRVHGIVGRLELGDEGKQITAYEITLVPRLSRLVHRRTSRIFQERTTPEIVGEVMARAGIPASAWRFALRARYRPRPYCVQYRESDLDFIHRLLEEEGISYAFEHTADAHVVVFGDDRAAHEPVAGGETISFRPPSGGLGDGEHVRRFRVAEEMRPEKVTLADFNFRVPALGLAGSAEAVPDTDLELYDAPGNHETPEAGLERARIRLEEEQARRRTGRGEGTCPRFAPGRVFTLAEHPRAELDGRYLITRVEHAGESPEAEVTAAFGYSNRFECIPAEVPYRAPRVTPRPTVKGVQTAIVVGPPNEEIYTDEHGRVKVQFHWDREGRRDEHSSCWIRVSQIGAGPAWGAMFLPRVGHEVVVDFVEGDPDRPLIVGSVYHGANVPPYPLPADRTRSTLKSRSSPGGEGSNELRFEDRKGSEEVYLHAERDLRVDVEDDKRETVGGDDKLSVSGDRTVVVDRCHTETILLAQTTLVGAALTQTVGLALTQTVGAAMTVSVAGAKTETVGAMSAETVLGVKSTNVGQAYAIDVGAGLSISAGTAIAASAGGNVAASAGANLVAAAAQSIDLNAGKDVSVRAGGNHAEQAVKERSILAGERLTFTCGTARIVVSESGAITIEGSDITVKSDGPILLDGKKVDVKTAGAVTVHSTGGTVKIVGSAVAVN